MSICDTKSIFSLLNKCHSHSVHKYHVKTGWSRPPLSYSGPDLYITYWYRYKYNALSSDTVDNTCISLLLFKAFIYLAIIHYSNPTETSTLLCSTDEMTTEVCNSQCAAICLCIFSDNTVKSTYNSKVHKVFHSSVLHWVDPPTPLSNFHSL